MLSQRGYIVDRELEAQSLEQFKTEMKGESSAKVRDVMMVQAPDKNDATKRICVFFGIGPGQKLGTDHVREYKTRMDKESATHGIIIEDGGLTPHGKATIMAINTDGSNVHIQTFKEAELLVNITDHVLVPKHVLLTPPQVEELLKRYNLKRQQLPRIQLNDPISRYYGLVRGDVVKIIRLSETAGRYVTYRYVM